MVSKHSNKYLQWALKALSSWDTTVIPSRTEIVQIHGTNDKTFPINLIKDPDYTIDQGSHFFVYNQAKKVAGILKNLIN
jgi:hypothetical protein